MQVRFVFIGEGPSDNGLIPHIEHLCIALGADEVTGDTIDVERLRRGAGKRVVDKARVAMEKAPTADLFLFHRDADSREGSNRHDEIAAAIIECGLTKPYVAVVPVQETEAWLLLDARAILRVAGKPNGNPDRLGLPAADKVENVANPKERLQEAILAASETTGRRREKIVQAFPSHRRLLLENLPITGPIERLSSWVRLRDDLRAALTRLSS